MKNKENDYYMRPLTFYPLQTMIEIAFNNITPAALYHAALPNEQHVTEP